MSKFIYIDNIFQFEKKIWNTISKCNNIKYMDFNGNIFLNKGNYNYLYTDELGNEYYSSAVGNPIARHITQPTTLVLPKNPTFDLPYVDIYSFQNPWGNIENIIFNKIYLKKNGRNYIIKDPTYLYYYQKDVSFMTTLEISYSDNAKHITTYNNNNSINMYAIVPDISSYIQTDYDIILNISLSGENNIEKWSQISNDNIEQTYKVECTVSDASKNTYMYQLEDLYPHWEIESTSITYYGGLSKLLNLSNTSICINIDPNVHLPFGFSNSKFVIDSSDNQALYNKLKSVIYNNDIIHNIKFNTPLGDQINPITVDDLSKLLKDSKSLSQYITSCTNSLPLNKITINGGIINGSIIKSSNCDWTNRAKYSSNIYPYEYLAMPWDVKPGRADQLSVSKHPKNFKIFQLLRSVEYWIFNGLLELYSNNIELNGVSVLCGMPRGIAPTQLNAYTHFPNASGYTTITNCQFCLNHYGQTDGLDILSNNVTYKNVYYQVADDTFKLASNNIKANNITIVSGANGGAINFGAYGTNINSISADISDIFIHVYNKPNNKLNPPFTDCPREVNQYPYCMNERINSNCHTPFWPGPSIIFAPINPTYRDANKQDITIKNIYVNNNQHINNNSSNNDYEPYTFLVGGFMSILNGYVQCSSKNIADPKYSNSSFIWNIFNIYYNNIDITNTVNQKRMGDGQAPLSYYINRVDNNKNQIKIYGISNDAINNYTYSQNIIMKSPYLKHQQWLGPDLNPITGTKSAILYKNACDGDNICWKCVDGGKNLKNNNPIMIWDCNELDQQKWFYDTSNNLICDLSSRKMCIDIPQHPSAGEGTALQLWECNSNYQNQKWITTNTNYQFKSKLLQKYCIDLRNGDTSNGTLLQLSQCDD